MTHTKEILNILNALSLTFDFRLIEAKARLYVDLLGDLDIHALRLAAREHMKRGKAFPLPGELREIAERIHPKFNGSASDTSKSAEVVA